MQLEGSRRAELAKILGVKPNAVALTDGVKSLEEAAVEEFVAMVLGDYNPQRIEDVREFRLMLLTKSLFEGRIPSADLVGKLFHLTNTQSRTLIRRTLATYQTQLGDVMGNTAAHILSSARKLDDDSDVEHWAFESEPQTVTPINELLMTRDPRLPPIRRRTNTVGQFVMEAPTYAALKEIAAAKST